MITIRHPLQSDGAKEDITRVVRAIEEGDCGAADRLLPLVYRELRSLAARHLAREAPGQTLQATALVHEAYLRVIGNDSEGSGRIGWDGRAHFFAAAAEAMRRILIDSARRKQAQRHGGGMRRVEFGTTSEAATANACDPVLWDHRKTRMPKPESPNEMTNAEIKS